MRAKVDASQPIQVGAHMTALHAGLQPLIDQSVDRAKELIGIGDWLAAQKHLGTAAELERQLENFRTHVKWAVERYSRIEAGEDPR